MTTVFTVTTIVLSCLGAFGLMANALLIYSVLRQPSLRRSPTYVTLVSLASSDFLSLFALLSFLLIVSTSKLNPALCTLMMYTGLSAVCSSTHHLVLFSVLRYIILARPFFAMKHLTVNASVLTCAAVWILALAFGVPAIFEIDMLPFNTSSNNTIELCLFDMASNSFVVSSIVVVVFIPYLLILAFHIAKVCQLRKRSIQPENGLAGVQVSVKIVTGILIAFGVTSIPNTIYWTILPAPRDLSLDEVTLGYSFSTVCFINNAINPFFYFFFSKNATRNILCCRRSLGTKDHKQPPPPLQDGVRLTQISSVEGLTR